MTRTMCKRERIVLVLGAAVYAALYACYSQIDEGGSCSLAVAVLRFLPALPVALAALLLLMRLIPSWLMERSAIRGATQKGESRPFHASIAFGLILLSFLPNWLVFYPGSFTYDTQCQVFQVANNAYDMFQPLIHTLLIRFCISLYDVVGSIEKTATLYAVIQMVIMALCFALICASIARVSSRRLARLAVCFFVLYPTHGIMASNCTKDVLFGGFLALFVTLCVEQTAGEAFPLRRWGLLILSGVMACLFRNNMIYALLVWTLILLLERRRMGRLCAAAVAVILLSQGMSAGLAALTNAEHGSVKEMLSVPVQQLARAMMVSRESFTEEELELVDELLPDQCYEDYTPSLSDPVKNHLNVEMIEREPLRVASLWFRVGLRCPGVYLDAFLHLTLPSLYPYSRYQVAASYVETGQRGGVWTEPFGQKPMVSPARFEPLRVWLKEHVWNTGVDHVPLIRLLFNTGAIFWACGACVLYAAYAGQRRRLCVLALPVLLHMTFLLGPVMQGRYLYPFVCLLPALLLTAKDER